MERPSLGQSSIISPLRISDRWLDISSDDSGAHAGTISYWLFFFSCALFLLETLSWSGLTVVRASESFPRARTAASCGSCCIQTAVAFAVHNLQLENKSPCCCAGLLGPQNGAAATNTSSYSALAVQPLLLCRCIAAPTFPQLINHVETACLPAQLPQMRPATTTSGYQISQTTIREEVRIRLTFVFEPSRKH